MNDQETEDAICDLKNVVKPVDAKYAEKIIDEIRLLQSQLRKHKAVVDKQTETIIKQSDIIDKHIELQVKSAQRMEAAKVTIISANDHIIDLEEQLKSKDAKIDALMLEYCPDEMTEEQKKTWAKYQIPVKETD